MSSHGLSSVYWQRDLISPPLLTSPLLTSPIGLIPTLMIHSIFMTFSEALSPNTVMMGVEASTCELVEGEDTVQSIKTS